MKRLFFLASILWLAACGGDQPAPPPVAGTPAADAPALLNVQVVNRLPHDTTMYTEGFLVHDGVLWESSGAVEEDPSTRSLIGTIDPATGRIQPKILLDKKKYFGDNMGEGILFLHGKLYQLTYKTRTGFVYDAKTLKQTGTFPIPTEQGWGMTTDGKSLILSDGTSNLTYLDPETFRLQKVVGVTDNNGPVANINELEYIHGAIYANVYLSNNIIKVDPESGKVLARADLSSLDKEAKMTNPNAEYMNGIAYDSAQNKIYVTGKLWPSIYEIRIN